MSRKQDKLLLLKKETRILINRIRRRVGRLKQTLLQIHEVKFPSPSDEGEEALFRLMRDWSAMTQFNILLTDIKTEGRHVYEK